MGDENASEYIIKRKQESFLVIHNKGQMHFCRDILMGHHREKRKILNYCIKAWHTSTTSDILRNQYTYPTMCLLLYRWHRNDHCIKFCGKWTFDSNLKMALPLTQVCLNYICCGNGTDGETFFGVLHAIGEVSLKEVQRRLNIKYELFIFIIVGIITIYIVLIFIFHVFIMV